MSIPAPRVKTIRRAPRQPVVETDAARAGRKTRAATGPAAARRKRMARRRQAGERTKLYFSEKPQDPRTPRAPPGFFITVDGQTPAAFDPMAKTPNITVHQGDVEDWVVENRSQELHAFHIHQTHFMLIEWNRRSGVRTLPARHGERSLLGRQEPPVSQREAAHGFSRPEHCRNVSVYTAICSSTKTAG